MCRIFGFRSILQSGVHRSLMDSENAIIQQSDRHPDGWGVAYYNMGSPHLVKNENQAKECKIFKKLSGVVSSNTVVTHIRKSTVGEVGPLNTHPFQFGPWVFAHNGNVEDFAAKREAFRQAVDPELRSFILGDTDSEHLFYLMLSLIKKRGELRRFDVATSHADLLQEYLEIFTRIAGPLVESKGDYDKNYLTFLMTNGKSMLALQGGQDLFFSTHKGLCSERKSCPHFKPICETQANEGEKIHHLLISSEMIKNENIWSPMKFGQFVSVDDEFNFSKGQLF